MSVLQTDSDELISKLACERYLGDMIRCIPPARPSTIQHRRVPSSIGLLDTLPTELLFLTLELLDFQSLSRISRVSVRGKAVVEALPAYRDMMEYAPTTLTALGKTRLLRYHSASLLLQTLRTAKCVSCFDFGGFLFLPTCERICFECLYANHAFRMTTIAIAKRCFGLTESHLQRIPITYSIPGTYGMKLNLSRRRVCRLVSIKQVKQLGIEIHGSAEALGKFMPTGQSGKMTFREFRIIKQFHDAPLEPPGCDMSRLQEKSNLVEDDFGGMASMRFPYLTRSGPDMGYLCRGCQITHKHQRRGLLPPNVLPDLVPPGVNPSRPFSAMKSRLRSRDGFLEHIRHCYGASQLLNQRRGK
ncbi:hypothetical protein F5Y10DRAFT_287343 [Nemania abortiva]|nr:hypothetical protein F5Y10DRAFT_287343 [Nemania abortiva]